MGQITLQLKNRGKKLLSRPCLSSMKDILSAVQNADVVSFDLFDTLIKRDVPSPEDVHTLVARRYEEQTGRTLPDYKRRRGLAEQAARAVSGGREITLEDIFRHFSGGKGEEAALLYELEIQAEYEVCCVNPYMQPVYQSALAARKRVMITSDIYLPEELIGRILTKCGIKDFDTLYLSSSRGVTKSSGMLFELLLEEAGCTADRILHIGDNSKSDYYRPRQRGIRACLIAAELRNLRYWRKRDVKDQEQRCFYAFLNNHKPPDGTDFSRHVGYEILGPMLLGFCTWLYGQLQELRPDRVFFLSREGALIHEACRILYPDSPFLQEYLYVSRQAVQVPLLAECRTYGEFLRVVKPLMQTHSLRNIGNSCHLDNRYQDGLKALGLKPDDDVFTLPQDRQEPYLGLVLRLGRERFQEQAAMVRRYLCQSGFRGRVAVVDIGWQGTMQKALLSYTGEEVSLAEGFYLVVRNVRPAAAYEGLNRHGYLAEPGEREAQVMKLSFTCEALEQLFLSQDGTVEGYRISEEGRVVPVLGRSEQTAGANQTIGQVQRAALRFLHDFSGQKSIPGQAVTAELLMRCYDRYAVHPSLETVQYFKSFCTQNSGVRSMLPAHTLPFYLLRPGRLFREMNDSCCKIFYLKAVCKLPLPYYEILKLLYDCIAALSGRRAVRPAGTDGPPSGHDTEENENEPKDAPCQHHRSCI